MRRRLAWALGSLLTLLALAVAGGGCALSAPTWQGPASDHFDGRRFLTPGAPRLSSASGFLKWQLSRTRGLWGARRDEPAGPTPPHHVEQGQMRVTFINHATTLIQLDGVNVLTDPIYAERASPVGTVGPRRVRPPGLAFEQLPPIDAVVISHNHYDHLDVPTLLRLQRAFPKVQVFAGLGNQAFLQAQGLREVHELDWGQSLEVKQVTIRSLPNQHFSGRGLFDTDGTLWTAFSLEGPHAGKAYFAGDTGYGPHFARAGASHGPYRLAVLPIGAYKPEWFMGAIHQTPSQTLQAAIDLGARTTVPMHFGTFDLADDGETEPIDELRKLTAAHPEAGVMILGFGEGRLLP